MRVRWTRVSAVCFGLVACGGKVDSSSNGGVSAGSVASAGSAGVGENEGGASSGPVRTDLFTVADLLPAAKCEPTAAMQTFANTLYNGPCRVEQDEGFDGTIESVFVHTYDSQGRLLSTRSESPQTGAAFQDTSTYDHEGQLIVHQTGPQDAGATWTDVYEYDDAGRLVRTTTGPLGPDQEPLTTHYIYDPEGLLLRLEQTRSPDGQIQSRVLFRYDPTGKHRLVDTYQNADGGAWVTWRVLEHHYDSAWREVETTEDRQAGDGSQPDGVADWSNRNYYDGYGNILVSAEDQGADGVVDKCTVRDYSCW